MTTARLAVIGVFPPPFGGVANHVQRLLPLLQARDVSVRVYNAVSASDAPPDVVSVARWRSAWLPFFLFTCRERAVLILSDRPFVWALAAFACQLRKRRLGLRLRNSRLIDVVAKGGMDSRLARYALPKMNLIICVNRELEREVRNLGVPSDAVMCAPGFLPPSARCVEMTGVSDTAWRFAKNAKPLVVANGKISWYKGADLYGLDLLIRLVGSLIVDYPNIKLVVCFWDYQEADAERLTELLEMAERAGVADAVLLHTEQGTMLPLLAQADLFIRPTITDGDANSIRESLALGIPTVASDVVERPDGCLVFENQNQADLERVARKALAMQRTPGRDLDLHISDDVRQVIEKYVSSLAALAGSDHDR